MREPLYRSRRDRVIGGLAAGMARNLGIEPIWIRIGWVVFALTAPPVAPLVYLALLFVIPEAPEGTEPDPDAPPAEPSEAGASPGASAAQPRATGDGSRSAALIIGLVLVGTGAWLLLRRFVPDIDWALSWPVIAIGVGVVLVLAALRTGRSD